MAVDSLQEAAGRLPTSHPLDPPTAAKCRLWLLHMARDAIHLCKVDRDSGQRESAMRWLSLARHLIGSAEQLTLNGRERSC